MARRSSSSAARRRSGGGRRRGPVGPAPPASPVDAVGAGDSFDAGLIAALLARAGRCRRARFACACGALSTRAAGGVDGQATMAEAEALAASAALSPSGVAIAASAAARATGVTAPQRRHRPLGGAVTHSASALPPSGSGERRIEGVIIPPRRSSAIACGGQTRVIDRFTTHHFHVLAANSRIAIVIRHATLRLHCRADHGDHPGGTRHSLNAQFAGPDARPRGDRRGGAEIAWGGVRPLPTTSPPRAAARPSPPPGSERRRRRRTPRPPARAPLRPTARRRGAGARATAGRPRGRQVRAATTASPAPVGLPSTCCGGRTRQAPSGVRAMQPFRAVARRRRPRRPARSSPAASSPPATLAALRVGLDDRRPRREPMPQRVAFGIEHHGRGMPRAEPRVRVGRHARRAGCRSARPPRRRPRARANARSNAAHSPADDRPDPAPRSRSRRRAPRRRRRPSGASDAAISTNASRIPAVRARTAAPRRPARPRGPSRPPRSPSARSTRATLTALPPARSRTCVHAIAGVPLDPLDDVGDVERRVQRDGEDHALAPASTCSSPSVSTTERERLRG